MGSTALKDKTKKVDGNPESEDLLENIDDANAINRVDSEIANMSDSMDENAAGEEVDAPPQDTSESDINIASREKDITSFLDSPEILSKKDSNDGKMTAIKRAVKSYKENMVVCFLYNSNETGDAKQWLEGIVSASSAYMDKKHPFFKKGKLRKARVKKLKEDAEFIKDNIDSMVGNDIVKSNYDVQSKVKNTSEKYQSKRNELKSQYKEKHNGNERMQSSLGMGMLMSGYSEDQADRDTEVVQFSFEKKGDEEASGYSRKEMIESTERAIDSILSSVDIDSFTITDVTDLFKGDINSYYAKSSVIFDTEYVFQFYDMLFTSSTKGLRYNTPEKWLEARAKFEYLEAMAGIYIGVYNMALNGKFKENPKKYLNLLKLSIEQLTKMMMSAPVDERQIILDAAAVSGSMEKFGFKFGQSKEEFMNKCREDAKKHMVERGIKI